MTIIFLRTAMLALVAWSSTARARADDGLPDSRLGLPTAPILLLSRSDVRAELKLTPEQTAGSERAIADLQKKGAALVGRKDEASINARRAIDQESIAWLGANLSADQRDRLTQLTLQWEGPAANIMRPVVAESLGLSREQVDGVRRALAERNKVRRNGPPNFAEERHLASTTLAVLDQSQREGLHALWGKPFFHVGGVAATPPPARR